MPSDNFSATADSTAAPSTAPFTITPSDAVALPVVPKALYVGTAGIVVLRGVNGAADVVFKNVSSGQVLDIRAAYVRATGTTAADIVGLA